MTAVSTIIAAVHGLHCMTLGSVRVSLHELPGQTAEEQAACDRRDMIMLQTIPQLEAAKQ